MAEKEGKRNSLKKQKQNFLSKKYLKWLLNVCLLCKSSQYKIIIQIIKEERIKMTLNNMIKKWNKKSLNK